MPTANRKIILLILTLLLTLSINCGLTDMSKGEMLTATQTALERTDVVAAKALTAIAESEKVIPPTHTPTMTFTPLPSYTPMPSATRRHDGVVAYDFCLSDLGGVTVCLNEYQGKLVVLSFFSTNCQYCRMEAPIVQKMYTKYQGEGLVILGIVPSEEGKAAIKKYVDRYNFTFPVLLDMQFKINNKYNLAGTGVPRNFFIDPFGNISTFHIGAMPEADWENYILRDLP
jgi:peroxiredoxin